MDSNVTYLLQIQEILHTDNAVTIYNARFCCEKYFMPWHGKHNYTTTILYMATGKISITIHYTHVPDIYCIVKYGEYVKVFGH